MRALVHNCPDAMPVFEDRICYDVIVFLKGGWNSEYSNIANHIETAGKTPEFIVGHRTGESILNLHSLITVRLFSLKSLLQEAYVNFFVFFLSGIVLF